MRTIREEAFGADLDIFAEGSRRLRIRAEGTGFSTKVKQVYRPEEPRTDLRLGYREYRTDRSIKHLSDDPGQLKMLRLVVANGNCRGSCISLSIYVVMRVEETHL